MPKGVPKAGFRMTKNRLAQMGGSTFTATNDRTIYHLGQGVEAPVEREPLSVISARIKERFDVMNQLLQSIVAGDSNAVIISGPAGVGKSHTVEEVLSSWNPDQDRFTITKGFVKATGLYKLLYHHREGGVLVFDDADSIFDDAVALNILKAVCDTTEKRTVSWLSEVKFVDEESGEVLPRKFQFEGQIVFLTNLDFDGLIRRQHKLSPHLEALMSRAHYVSLAMNTDRAKLVRVVQVINEGMFNKFGFSKDDCQEIVDFMTENLDRLRAVSLREAVKLANLKKSNPNWRMVAKTTACRNRD